MAIYERDRDFKRIFNEIEVGVIPLRFIRDIVCYLNDGSEVTLDEEDIKKAGDADDVESLIRELHFFEMLTDLRIRIDYARVEEDVDGEVAKILKRLQ